MVENRIIPEAELLSLPRLEDVLSISDSIPQERIRVVCRDGQPDMMYGPIGRHYFWALRLKEEECVALSKGEDDLLKGIYHKTNWWLQDVFSARLLIAAPFIDPNFKEDDIRFALETLGIDSKRVSQSDSKDLEVLLKDMLDGKEEKPSELRGRSPKAKAVRIAISKACDRKEKELVKKQNGKTSEVEQSKI